MTTFEFTPANVMSFLAMFECERCNECERKISRINVTRNDAIRIAEHLNMSPDDFLEKYCYPEDKKVFLPSPCPFWDGFGCRIWEVKPEVCCQFPFNQPVKCGNKMMITINTGCPAGKKLAEKFGINPAEVKP
jgi:Fe-S-cluster containining protein